MACGHIPTAQSPGKPARVSPPADGSIAITNVTIVNLETGAQDTAVTVVTKAGRIADMGREISVPAGAARVDGTEKFRMIAAHIHSMTPVSTK